MNRVVPSRPARLRISAVPAGGRATGIISPRLLCTAGRGRSVGRSSTRDASASRDFQRSSRARIPGPCNCSCCQAA